MIDTTKWTCKPSQSERIDWKTILKTDLSFVVDVLIGGCKIHLCGKSNRKPNVRKGVLDSFCSG